MAKQRTMQVFHKLEEYSCHVMCCSKYYEDPIRLLFAGDRGVFEPSILLIQQNPHSSAL